MNEKKKQDSSKKLYDDVSVLYVVVVVVLARPGYRNYPIPDEGYPFGLFRELG